MQTIAFSYNWNNKLNCNYFTTLRLSSRFQVDEWLMVTLKHQPQGRVIVVEKKPIKIGQLNPFICGIDTGYSVAETKNILSKMYPNQINDATTIYLYLLRRETDGELKARQEAEKNNQHELFQ